MASLEDATRTVNPNVTATKATAARPSAKRTGFHLAAQREVLANARGLEAVNTGPVLLERRRPKTDATR